MASPPKSQKHSEQNPNAYLTSENVQVDVPILNPTVLRTPI